MNAQNLTDEELDDRLAPLLDERARRREAAEKKWWDDFNEKHGPCPECDTRFVSGRFIGGEGKVVQEHRVSDPDYACWPLPPLPGHGLIVGVDWETTLTCEQGHRTVKRETIFYEKPIKEMFGG